MLYFAYGSNLSMRQMLRRCPDSRAVSRAVLHGYRLVFPRGDSEWKGGVAGIEPDGSAHVEGAVYEVCDSDVRSLDRYEAVADGEYARADVRVTLPDDRELQVYTYVAAPQPGGPFTPSPRYLQTILEGAAEHGLSAPWIDYLRRFA
jgi:gamma-glutamylcyclotransferase (GGCT)/AIG2-like uncharacterized protein YtfP